VRFGLGLCLGLAAFAAAVPSVHAFPPAPFHTLHGTARNEFGQPLEGKDIRVILETPSGKTLQTAVGWVSVAGANYVIKVPMDTGLFDAPYHASAMRPTAPFRLRVLVGRTVYLPLEMKGDFRQLGKPGERTQIDLTLGEDADGDGLPDAWERQMLALLGMARIEDVKPGDDADGDGLTNLDEYIAGSYAFDAADGFRLDILEKAPDGPVMQFLAVRGRTYFIESSGALDQWSVQPFRVAGDGTPVTSYRAADTRVMRIVAVVPGGGAGFFRVRTQ
jgi:hypothetical protein